jgi:hypothetical protein
MSSFCPNCGAALQPGAKFCPDCGQALQAVQSPTPPPPTQANEGDINRQAMQVAPSAISEKRPSNALVWVVAVYPLVVVFWPDDWPIMRFTSGVLLLLLVIDYSILSKNLGYNKRWLLFWALLLYPVYLYKRAKLLKQKPTYFIVSIFTILLSIIISFIIGFIIGIVNLIDDSVPEDSTVSSAYHELTTGVNSTEISKILEEVKASRKAAYDKYNGKRLELVGTIEYNGWWNGPRFIVDGVHCDWRESRVKVREEGGWKIIAFVGANGENFTYGDGDRITFEGVIDISMDYEEPAQTQGEEGEEDEEYFPVPLGPLNIRDCTISNPKVAYKVQDKIQKTSKKVADLKG